MPCPPPAPARSPRPHARRLLAALAAGAFAVSAAACSSSGNSGSSGGGAGGGTTPATAASAYPQDGVLKLNQLQALGSHNSYHRETPQAFRDLLEKVIPGVTSAWLYEEPPLDEQLAQLGIRQIELDVHLDPDQRFATRKAMPLAGLPADGGPALHGPGLKVFHIQEVDFASSCDTFVACLTTVKRWSDANPGHAPIAILVEAKDDDVPDVAKLGFATSVKFDAAGLEQIDTEVRSVFNDDQLITPDDVRGDKATLEQAVLGGGWPTLGQARGKVLFLLDNAALRQAYAQGHPSLQGRVMFTNAEPGEPEAAFVERNDAVKDGAEIGDLVRKGYVVRTRADADSKEAKANDPSTSEAALRSGAQWVSTDYARPDPALSPYSVRIPGGTPARCNPVNAPAGCRPQDIEDPAHLTSP